jgi:hypothetical protein
MTLEPTMKIALFHSNNAGKTWTYQSGALTLATAKASVSMASDGFGVAGALPLTRTHTRAHAC